MKIGRKRAMAPTREGKMRRADRSAVASPALTRAMLESLRPAREVVPDVVRAARGRPPKPDKKMLITMRLDQDVLEHFRKSGPGWQVRINETLRKAAKLKEKAR